MAPKKPLTAKKAREMLQHGSVHGESLTPKQKRLFGAVASGQRPKTRKGR